MRRKMGLITTSALAGVAATSLGMAMIAANQAQPGERERNQETEQFEGRIVDLYNYLARDEGDRAPGRDPQRDPQRNPQRDPQRDPMGDPQRDQPTDPLRGADREKFGGAIGIVTEREGLITTQTRVHVLVFDPNREQSKDMLNQLKGKIGQEISVTGRSMERDGLRGIAVTTIHGAGTPGTQRDRDRDGDRDGDRDW